MNTKILSIFCMTSFSCIAFADSLLPNYSAWYAPTDGYWGDWGAWDRCPQGQYVDGFKLKSESYQGEGDDTGLNGISLHCNGGANVSSSVAQWGSWSNDSYCYGPAIGFAIQIESPQGDNADDTAANNFKLICSSGNSAYANVQTNFGNWSQDLVCPAGQVVVGIQTRVESDQVGGDDTALNGARLICGYR
ncbi:hypothetical protein [Fluviispira vulneris]|uniref:hypothetical protein n=1 Tax=Fluviispira vulneris TaxID=2763012 RepID=UPI001648A1C9|nr:hypothetical protein [Fluviispira vulneris]